MSGSLIPAGRGPALPLDEGESISVINVTGTPVVDCKGDHGTFREGASFRAWWTGPVAIELPRTASWLLLSAISGKRWPRHLTRLLVVQSESRCHEGRIPKSA